ncbi:hypothetical protein L7F22_062817 [Adiantum nelumboides]|nr:hypothetical protein [Adiantum nelumboides]
MYATPVWAPSLIGSWWTQVERPHIIMLSRLIRTTLSVPHDIIRAELATPPMLVEALFQTVCFIQQVRQLPRDRLSYRALEASRQLAESRESGSWYAQMTQWFNTHGLDIQQLPPFEYASPLIHLSHEDRNRVLIQDLWQLYIRRHGSHRDNLFH